MAGFDDGMAVAVHSERTCAETLERILEIALKAVPCERAAVITANSDGDVTAVTATDGIAAALAAMGPLVTLLGAQGVVLVPDSHAPARCAGWAARAAGFGVRSLLGVRLLADGVAFGALEVYDSEPNRFAASEQATAEALAFHAGLALACARRKEQLSEAAESRTFIGQAEGVLMERFGLDEDQAFRVLLRYSQDSNTKLRVVAEAFLANRELPDRKPMVRDDGGGDVKR